MSKITWYGLKYKKEIIMVLSDHGCGKYLTVEDFDGHDVPIPSGCKVVELRLKEI